MPLLHETVGAGVAILCDQAGRVRQILRDDLGLTQDSLPGTLLETVLAPADPKDIAALLAEVQTQSAAFDWELPVTVQGEVLPLHIAAGRAEERILFVGELSRKGIALRFYEEMMQINNEQVNALRAALKQKVTLTQELQEKEREFGRLYDEFSALNNELVNLQRQLGKQNVELATQKAALREYAENLEQMVAEKVRELEMERAKAIQMDKMASLGQMATGIAHELNQPLAAITFEADYLRSVVKKAAETERAYCELLPGAELAELGENLKQDVARCRRIVDHLREFGRTSPAAPAPMSLNHSIEGSLILLGARLREHSIDVRLALAEDLPLMLGNTHRIEQVIINLLSNAEHALQEKAEEKKPQVLEIATFTAGEMVVATVRDNGVGMSAAARERLFEPFFTTKPLGQGTGLGLSISYDIVAEYGGEITCDSVEGEGTTFTLRFPATATESE